MKAQLLGRIKRYQIYLQQGIAIPDEFGEDLTCINFSFQSLVDEFLSKSADEEQQTNGEIFEEFKLKDGDLEGLLNDLGNVQFSGQLNLDGQDITDLSVVRIANLIRHIPLSGLVLSNTQMSYIGGLELGNALKSSNITKLVCNNCTLGMSTNIIIENLQNMEELDLGYLGNKQLRYLSLQNHQIQHLAFCEDVTDPWDQETKETFLRNFSKSLLSVTMAIVNGNHKKFIGQIELKCQDNRGNYLRNRTIDYKAKDIDTEHPDYFDADNFTDGAFKFSVKQYLSNVFESLLDESLYYLEKERQNVLRDEAIFQVTHELVPKDIMEDICTADGSLIVLAKYLIGKLKK